MRENFNLFEPSLDITTPYLPYEDLGIQGVWPRNHKIPADIFPTFAHIGGTNVEKTKVHTASFTDDRRLRVDTGSSGGGGGTMPPYGATKAMTDWNTATSYTFAQDVTFQDTITTIWRLQLIAGLDSSGVGHNQPAFGEWHLQGFPNGTRYDMGMMVFRQNTGVGASIDVGDVRVIDIVYPGGWTNLPFTAPGDRYIRAIFEAYNEFINIVAGSIEYS